MDKVLENKGTHSWMDILRQIDGMQPLDYNILPKACKS